MTPPENTPARPCAPQWLTDFVTESNMIEGIHRPSTEPEMDAHIWFMLLPSLTVQHVCDFVTIVAQAPLRDKVGMDVYVGNHTPPKGGRTIRESLETLIARCNYTTYTKRLDPYEAHVAYETLHPFMDGNGRSGRVIWAWMMERQGFSMHRNLGFLHSFYYQALAHSNGRK